MKVKSLQKKIKEFNASLEELAIRQAQVIKDLKVELQG